MRGWGLFVFAVLAGTPLLAAAENGEVIRSIGVQLQGEADTPRILDLLGLREGDRFSEAALEQGLVRLAETGHMQMAQAQFDPNTGALSLELQPLETLAGVEISLGTEEAPDYLRADVLEVLGLSTGDPIYVDSLNDLRDRVSARLKERGYLQNKVILALEARGESQERRLLITVELGPRARAHELRLRGFRASDVEEMLKHLRRQSEIEELVSQINLPQQIFHFSSSIFSDRFGRGQDEKVEPDLSLSVHLPLDWIAFTQGLNRWSQAMRERGYYDFQVTASVEEGENENAIAVTLQRGPRYRVKFHGNTAFWTRDLRARVLDRTLRLGVPLNLSEAEALLTRLYQSKGYLDFSVANRVEDHGGEARTVHFDLHEGRQAYLGKIRLDGVNDVDLASAEEAVHQWLKGFESPFHRIYFDEKLLRAQLPSLLQFLRRKGYLQARILEFRPLDEAHGRFVDVELSLQMGSQSLLKSIAILGNVVLSNEELEKIVDLEPGGPVDPEKIAEVNRNLLRAYRNLGFLYARVEDDEAKVLKVSPETGDVDAELSIESGPEVFLDKTIVQGLRKTKERVVLRELEQSDLQNGAVWAPEKVNTAEQRLLGLGIFSGVRTEAVGGRILSRGEAGNMSEAALEKQEKDLKVTVSERPGGAIEFGPGFRTDLGLIGFAEYTYRNLGGWNRSLVIRGQLSRKLDDYQFIEQRYSISYLEPYLAESPLHLRLTTNYTKADETVYHSGQKVDGFNSEEISFGSSLERDFGPHWHWTQNLYTLSLPRIFDIIRAPDSSRRTYRIGTMGTTLAYDRRDNIFNTTRGWLLSSSLQLASPLFGSDRDANFLTLRESLAAYLPLMNTGAVIALALNYNRLWGLGESLGVPQTERLYLGGRGSVRSYSENALRYDDTGLLGEESYEGKLEMRVPVLLDLGMAYFIDVGQISATRFRPDVSTAPEHSGLRKAIGVGFRYATPVGPIALDFAANPDPRPSDDAFKIQFSIGSF